MKKYSLIVTCLFLQLFSVVAQETYSDAVKQADDYLKNGKYEEAYKAYSKAIGFKADEYKIWVNRGICLMNQKRYNEAVNDFNQALKLRANDPGALQGRASSKAMLKDYNGAIADLTTLITLKPTDYSSMLERGKIKVQNGDFAGALVDLKECQNHSFKPAETHYTMGVAYFAQKDFKRAAEALDKAFNTDNSLIDASFRGALAYAELGRFTKAVSLLNDMMQKESSNVNYYILRATLNIKAQKTGQAKTDIEKINELKPGSMDAVVLRIMMKNGLSDYDGALSEIDSLLKRYSSGNELLYLERGKALYHLAKYEEAESMFESAAAMNSINVETYLEWCQMYIEQKEYRKAVIKANKAIELNENLPRCWYLKGRALMGLDLVDEAIVAIHQGLDLDTEQPEVGYHYLGMAYHEKRIDSEAMKQFEKALSANATYAQVRIDRGNILLKQGKVQDALLDFQTVLKNDPDNASANCGQGKVYLQQKKYELALQAFSKAIKLLGANYEAYAGRGQAYEKLGKQEQAMEDYSHAIELNDGFADAYYYRGLLNKKKGDASAAKSDFETASSYGNKQADKELEALKKQ